MTKDHGSSVKNEGPLRKGTSTSRAAPITNSRYFLLCRHAPQRLKARGPRQWWWRASVRTPKGAVATRAPSIGS